jgi:Flp pilus assembly protein TadG
MHTKLETSLIRSHRLRQRQGLRGSRRDEQGIIIVLVAVFMLGVVGAMAALSIDVVTLYTARSEAQLVADAGALAAARALANSGATSDPDRTGALMTLAEPIATQVAVQVAQSSTVGGRNLVASNGEVVVSFSDSKTNACTALNPVTNPCVTVSVQRSDLPTFFARIWGSKQIKVAASATAEAYNPTNISAAAVNGNPPVAPICVKPWLLPNMDPTSPPGNSTTIFDPASGTVTNPGLLGWTTPSDPNSQLHTRCGNCNRTPGTPLTPLAWRYYPGDPTSFPAPTQALPSCPTSLTTPYEESIAGCVQRTIACNGSTAVLIDNSVYPGRNRETAEAVNCLSHAANGGGTGDTVTPQVTPTVPFEFIAGTGNPIPGASRNSVTVSDSLVTVPVIDATPANWASLAYPQVRIVGFAQIFVNANGNPTQVNGSPVNGPAGRVYTTIVNLVGCGTSATGTPILGNGASPVAVRLISP